MPEASRPKNDAIAPRSSSYTLKGARSGALRRTVWVKGSKSPSLAPSIIVVGATVTVLW
jgi:hypothetical protein